MLGLSRLAAALPETLPASEEKGWSQSQTFAWSTGKLVEQSGTQNSKAEANLGDVPSAMPPTSTLMFGLPF